MPKNINAYLPHLALTRIPGVGSILYKRLIEAFGSPERVFNASENALCRIKGISSTVAERILSFKRCPRSEQELEMIQRRNLNMTAITDQDYPVLLKEIPDPPPVLTYKGTLVNDAPCIAVVGSRNATPYGLDAAFRFAADLAGSGFQVVSGMARGIDTAAHRGALSTGGRSVAVLGCGLATVYPPENRGLFNDLAENGAVISEFAVHAGPDAKHFPIRNRMIAGMSTGTVVVEAAARSGSLITARLASEYGREVFAVPGSIRSSKSQGTHLLLKQGATLTASFDDIIEQLHHLVHVEKKTDQIRKAPVPLPFEQQDTSLPHTKIKTILSPYPMHIDEIIQRSGLDPGTVSAVLLDLELQGCVQQTPGKHFAIIEE